MGRWKGDKGGWGRYIASGALLAVLLGGGGILFEPGLVQVLGVSLARPTPPAQPTILSGPSSPTTATTASFTYQDVTPAVTFKCSLDAGDFTACPSTGVTYTALAEGSHTFGVEAVSASAGAGAAASRSWVIDRTAPRIVLTFPASAGVYSAQRWDAGCTPPGICGTASDPAGVATVQVAVLQQATHLYWTGSSFSSPVASYQNASGTTAWRLGLASGAMADGLYTASVRATDGLGNTTPPGSLVTATFRIDTIPPPPPQITQAPDDPTFDTSATLAFKDAEIGVSFLCHLDGGALAACNSGAVQYVGIATGNHCFGVIAVDAAGNQSPATSFCWTVLLRNTFPISGNFSQLFFPGVTQPLNLVFTNPFNFDIRVTGVTVTVQATTTKGANPNPGCNGTQNFAVTRPFSGAPVVARNSTRSLSDLGVPAAQWPLVSMPDLPISQDACKGTDFHMTYQGTAVKA